MQKEIKSNRVWREEAKQLRELLNQVEKAYVKLTCCEWYGDDDEVHGVLCPNSLLKEFDSVLLRPTWKD